MITGRSFGIGQLFFQVGKLGLRTWNCRRFAAKTLRFSWGNRRIPREKCISQPTFANLVFFDRPGLWGGVRVQEQVPLALGQPAESGVPGRARTTAPGCPGSGKSCRCIRCIRCTAMQGDWGGCNAATMQRSVPVAPTPPRPAPPGAGQKRDLPIPLSGGRSAPGAGASTRK